jgi:ribosomal protein S18 acetylase RimI-like enzyme
MMPVFTDKELQDGSDMPSMSVINPCGRQHDRGIEGSSPCASVTDSTTDDDEIDDPEPRTKLVLRPIHPSDRQEIQTLHETWFPVRYQDDFYEELVNHRMVNTGNPLFTSCCVLQHSDLEACGKEEIAACVVGAFVNRTKLSDELQSLLISNPERYTQLFYIMTLGTVTHYRQSGLGTTMIQRCIEEVERHPECGVLYLHVITFNEPAIRFYEKLGFYRVQEIPDYYTIDDVNHSCYLYARYFNGMQKCCVYYSEYEYSQRSLTLTPTPFRIGNRGHLHIYKVFSRALSIIWNRIKIPLAILLDVNDHGDP